MKEKDKDDCDKTEGIGNKTNDTAPSVKTHQ